MLQIFLLRLEKNQTEGHEDVHLWVRQQIGKSYDLKNAVWKINPNGKPFLDTPYSHPSPHFNLSHSGSYAVLAVSHQEVGIDIEYKTPKFTEALLQRFFPLEEQNFVKEFSPTQQAEAFLYLWTCKESLLKYIGCGLGKGLAKHALHFDSQKRVWAQYQAQTLHFHSYRITSPSLEKQPYFITVCSALKEANFTSFPVETHLQSYSDLLGLASRAEQPVAP